MRHSVTMVVVMATLAAAAAASAAEAPGSGGGQAIYVYTGDHGELAFSDVAHAGAERLELSPAPQSAEAAQEELDRRIERTLRVADALERSRLAREKARAEARAAMAETREPSARAPEPVVVSQDRYVTSPLLLGAPARRHAHRLGPRFDRPRHTEHGDHERGREEPTLYNTFPHDRD